MTKNLNHAHGGDLDAIQRTYGIPKEEIIEKGKGNPYIMYPRVTKQSEKVIELEKNDEIF